MNIIDERDVRTIHRKLQKKKYDEILKLSVGKTEKVRLLDEGMVVDANGHPLFYLTKGTMRGFLDVLPDDYEGSINLGHMPFAQFPILLGKWRKGDLSLVDIGDGRQALDVVLHLDEENFIVKELRRAEYDLGLSAEFGYHVNEELSAKYGLEIIDEIFIHNFAIVGEAGNVNSSGIRLGGKGMNLQELQLALETGGAEATLDSINKKLDALIGEEPKKEEPKAEEPKAEEPAEEPKKEEEPKAEEPQAEEPKAEEAAEEPAEEEQKAEEPAEEDAMKKALSLITQLQERVTTLEAEKAALEQKLSVQKQSEKEFIEKMKNLSVSFIPKTESVAEVEAEDVYTDGLGA